MAFPSKKVVISEAEGGIGEVRRTVLSPFPSIAMVFAAIFSRSRSSLRRCRDCSAAAESMSFVVTDAEVRVASMIAAMFDVEAPAAVLRVAEAAALNDEPSFSPFPTTTLAEGRCISGRIEPLVKLMLSTTTPKPPPPCAASSETAAVEM